MKPLPLSKFVKKTPETGVYALSSLSRTTLLLVAKESNGRIARYSREKSDVLSLKIKFESYWIFCFPSPPRFLFPFLISFPICFSFFFSFLFSPSFFFYFIFSPFLLIFSFLFSLLSSFLEHIPHPVKGANFLPFSSNQICGSQFFILKSLFLYFLYDIIHSSGSL